MVDTQTDRQSDRQTESQVNLIYETDLSINHSEAKPDDI